MTDTETGSSGNTESPELPEIPESSELLEIDDNRVVSMHYQLTNGFGELIDSSQGDLPMVYMHNTNAILPSLERELTGKRVGEPVAVTIYPEDAYGYADPDLIAEWPRQSIEEKQELAVGMRFKALGKNDESMMVTVKEIREDTVVLDGNHPLAGQVLNFTLAIVSVREPTEAELAQGYATETNIKGT